MPLLSTPGVLMVPLGGVPPGSISPAYGLPIPAVPSSGGGIGLPLLSAPGVLLVAPGTLVSAACEAEVQRKGGGQRN